MNLKLNDSECFHLKSSIRFSKKHLPQSRSKLLKVTQGKFASVKHEYIEIYFATWFPFRILHIEESKASDSYRLLSGSSWN